MLVLNKVEPREAVVWTTLPRADTVCKRVVRGENTVERPMMGTESLPIHFQLLCLPKGYFLFLSIWGSRFFLVFGESGKEKPLGFHISLQVGLWLLTNNNV